VYSYTFFILVGGIANSEIRKTELSYTILVVVLNIYLLLGNPTNLKPSLGTALGASLAG